MLERLLKKEVYDSIVKSGVRPETLFEIRLRIGRPLVICDKRGSRLAGSFSRVYTATAEDVEYTLSVASGHSVYAVSEQLIRGYVSYKGGVRIGVCGEGVTEDGRLTALKNISGLNIRIPHEVKGCAECMRGIISRGLKNILVVSPPGGGKTTLLRELTRLYSDAAYNILVIDERNEIAAVTEGVAALDVGEFTDVISGAEKALVYRNVIRSMRPDMIVTDELFCADDAAGVRDIIRSGVRVMASVHAKDLADLENTEFSGVLRVFDVFVILDKPGGAIKVVER
ncbi:MAG: Flp pilus assembly complex ATPase component TadA [Clostridiales bacterium]|jgi:stage III sporulation protein AA|nr:Flp pilus assembly complex ATPase component TadA [Clostridiales bacterium]